MNICPKCGACYEQSMIASMHPNLQKDIKYYTEVMGIDVEVFNDGHVSSSDNPRGHNTRSYYPAKVPLVCNCNSDKRKTPEEINEIATEMMELKRRRNGGKNELSKRS